MSVQKPQQVWESVLGHLQLQITRPSYETWLRGTVGLSFEGGEFVVGTPNTFVAEMLDQRMYSLISQVLNKTVEGATDIRFQVMAQGQHSTDGVSEPNGLATRREGSADSSSVQKPHRNTSVNPRYTFGNFIVGKSNELAQAASHAVSERPGVTYNPLFIYSGVGLGKTHLLHAIGHNILNKGLSLIYATTEEFTNEFIKAIREGKTEMFRNQYRGADVLLLDDIQFIIGKEQTQEGFFHTFNALHMAGKQIVITSDRPASALTLLEDRVKSRLVGGLSVDIQPPDLETRLAILRSKGEATGQSFSDEVIHFLAERVHSNIRELEGTLNRVAAYAQLVGRLVTIDFVKQTVGDILNTPTRRNISDQQVVDAVSSYFSIDKEVLKGRRRDKHTSMARQIAMFILREEADLTLASIGQILGGKDHSTVLHACQKIEGQLNHNSHLRRDVLNIKEALAKA